MAGPGGAGRGRGGGATILVALVLAAIVVLMTFLAFRSAAQSRQDLRDRFEARASLASRFLEIYRDEIAEREAQGAKERLSGDVTPEALGEFARNMGFIGAVLLDKDGELIALYPHRAELIGQNLAKRDIYPHLASAVRGEVGVSPIVPSAAEGLPVIAYATPFDADDGRRVFSGAFAVEDTPIGAYVANISPIRGFEAFIVDTVGNVISPTTTDRVAKFDRLEPDLADATRTLGATGTYDDTQDGKKFFAVEPVMETPWRLVLSVPEVALFEPLSGTTTFLPFALVIALGLAGITMIRLFVVQVRDRDRVAAALVEQERLSEALNQFAGRVAHDLRSPLASAKMWSDLAQRDPDVQEKANGAIIRAADRGIQLIEDLLNFARASGAAHPTEFDPRPLVDEVTQEVDGVQIEVDGLPARIVADRVALGRAIENLARNAARYGHVDGESAEVTISGTETKGEWQIAVADRGPGVPAEEADGIFDAFTRGSETTLTGTGLGLAIVSSVAAAHQGRAWYEAREGGGARFVIAIPKN